MNNSHFARAESDVNIQRSRLLSSKRVLTSMNAGFLTPLCAFEVLPGSTFDIDVSTFVRASTPIHPVMDDAFLDLYAFWVPLRQTWIHAKEFFGEPNADPFADDVEYLEPVVRRENIEDEINGIENNPGSIGRRSLAAYYGVPIGSRPPYVNAKFARGYGLIWNRWFRAQQLQQAIDVPLDDSDQLFDFVGGLNLPDVQDDPDYYINTAKSYGPLAPVNKFHDYFTSALTQPQLGDPASIPLNGIAPVYAVSGLQNVVQGTGSSLNLFPGRSGAVQLATSASLSPIGDLRSAYGGQLRVLPDGSDNGTVTYLNNLVADLGFTDDLSKSLGQAYSTITDLRYAFATQKYLEINNRFGVRYREFLLGHFGVQANNIELQDPEFLGGKRIHVGMQQVVQTSSTDDVSPQGNLAAYSLTTDKDFLFRKSFTEHGVIHILACVRTNHSYQQGLNKMFSKRSKWDYYSPEFANISELPVYTRELFMRSDSGVPDDQIFGYQEAWAEYRYDPHVIHGQFSSLANGSFDIWHYGDFYESAPTLSAGWIAETYKNVDRTLAVTSAIDDQFKCDFAFNITKVLPMPVYSIPGLGPNL